MPHKCVKCGKYFADGSSQLMKGCTCGGRVFLFIRPEQMPLKDLYEAGVEIAVQNDKIQELANSQPVSIELDFGDANDRRDFLEPVKAIGLLPATAAKQSSHIVSIGKFGAVGIRPGAKAPKPKELDAAENVTIVEKGVYELDLEALMRGDPLVVRSQNGVYYVKIPAVKRKK